MLKQIRYFQAVVRCHSFSEAAEQCYISQSAISQHVQALERELGVKLLKRENRRFSLTPAGDFFYRRSLSLVAEYDRMCRETAEIASGKEFSLRIGCTRGYGGEAFRGAVVEFSSRYPDVPIEVSHGSHEELYELLRGEQVDLILSDQRRAFSDEYVNFVLGLVSCHIEISPRSRAAGLERVSAEDLSGIPCILVASREQQEHERSYYQEIYGIESAFVFAENLEEARLMVVGGKGFLPVEGGKTPAHFEGAIVRRPLCRNGSVIRRTYCAFWKVNNSGFFVEEFADLLKAQFSKETE